MTEGFQVTEEYEIGDLSDQTGNDLLDPAKAVVFVVKEVKHDTVNDKQTGAPMFKKLNIQAKISPLGVDGSGRFAGKVLFAQLTTWFDETRFSSDWWKKQARFPLKQFLAAMGYSPNALPKVNDDLFMALKDKMFKADITIENVTQKVDGKYVPTGDKKNELKNFRKAE